MCRPDLPHSLDIRCVVEFVGLFACVFADADGVCIIVSISKRKFLYKTIINRTRRIFSLNKQTNNMLASVYWHIDMDNKSKPKSAFATRQGLFRFRVMPIGLCNAPVTFDRLVNLVLSLQELKRLLKMAPVLANPTDKR